MRQDAAHAFRPVQNFKVRKRTIDHYEKANPHSRFRIFP